MGERHGRDDCPPSLYLSSVSTPARPFKHQTVKHNHKPIQKQAGAATTAFPRAQVSESNGEVSCSVEETNRVRALLGLRPLDLEKKESAVEVAMRNMAEKKVLACFCCVAWMDGLT